MRIIVGSDHAGFEYKNELLNILLERGIHTDDAGTYTDESCDYPDFAHAVGSAVNEGKYDFGV